MFEASVWGEVNATHDIERAAEQTHSAHPSRHTQKYGSPGVWIQQGFENNWSERKNPTSITSACFQPLVTTQKVLSGPITPHLGWAQRWFFKEKMPFGIFELWQRKNRPLKNTHPKSITIFKCPVSKQKKKKPPKTVTPQSYNLAWQSVTQELAVKATRLITLQVSKANPDPGFLQQPSSPTLPAELSGEKLARCKQGEPCDPEKVLFWGKLTFHFLAGF